MMSRHAQVLYGVPRSQPGWELSEEKMPESKLHDEIADLLRAIFAHWASKQDNVEVARNLAIRWDEEEPAVGVDPDVSVLSPAPPRAADLELRSIRTWIAGHSAPPLAVEIVSTTNPNKDYVIAPDKYAASGTRELWIFDPLLSGPRSHGGPFHLQIWARDDQGMFVRRHAGEAPGYSEFLGAYVVTTSGGTRLRVASDPGGHNLWPSEADSARADAEAAKAEAEAARADAARALQRVAELEALLAKK